MAALGCIYEYDDDVYCVLCIVKWGSWKWEMGREGVGKEGVGVGEGEGEGEEIYVSISISISICEA